MDTRELRGGAVATRGGAKSEAGKALGAARPRPFDALAEGEAKGPKNEPKPELT